VQHAVALPDALAYAEGVAEVQVADVLGVVVPGDDDGAQPGVEQRLEVLLGGAELVGVPVGGEVAADHDEIRLDGDDLAHGRLQQGGVEEGRSAVEVRQLGDQELLARHGRSVGVVPRYLW
jgi:hypothetical protein